MKILELVKTLDRSYTELKERTIVPKVEEVQKLASKKKDVEEQIKKEISNTPVCFRPISHIYHKIFGALNKIEKIDQNISDLLEIAKRHQEQQSISKRLWELQRKGLLGYQDVENVQTLFYSYTAQMKAVNCIHTFALVVISKEDGLLELLVFNAESEQLKKYSITVIDDFQVENNRFETIEELLSVYAPSGLPLNQLQDVASWLETHATSEHKISHILNTSEIEQKLSDLLKTSPQGAYILHPDDEQKGNSLKLSRIYQKGKIHHLTVDLTKRLGYYTISDEQGQLACQQTRIQFRRSLEQMGIPLRLKVADSNG